MGIRILKILFFAFIVRPIMFIGLGLNIFNREKLVLKGPAVLASNHNSHLDTMVLMSLYPLSAIHRVRPVAAADYFLSNPLLAWFSLNVIGIIPLERRNKVVTMSLFDECYKALDRGEILIIFPEGSRGSPETLSPLKKGIYHLLKERPEVPVIPIIMHGLGRALPRGEGLFVPFNCDVVVGDPLYARGQDVQSFMDLLSHSLENLFTLCITRNSAH